VIVRYEHWGAWVKLERTPALVALDRDGVRALGLDGGRAWDDVAPVRKSAPLEVHVAVTQRCAAGCEGCYLDATPDGAEPPRAQLERTLDDLARRGVFTVAFGGGEPTLRDDLGDLADYARARGLTPVVTTSGLGLGPAKLARLERFAQVNVSYDGPAEAYEAVRGFDGASAAERAIEALAARGVNVGVNVVLTRATFDRLHATLARARALGACEAQLLRYKPAGRAVSLDYRAKRLTLEQAKRLGPLLREIVGLRVRIDCALVPFLSADPDLAARPEDLAQWGIFGCEAGAALSATTVDGAPLPCSFARGLDAASFGAFVAHPPEPCASCTLRPVCRGGCKVVAQHLTGTFVPDPECPRVRGA